MATTYIVRKNSRPAADLQGPYRKFAQKSGGRGGKGRPNRSDSGRGSRGDSRGGKRGGRGGFQEMNVDVNKLVNKVEKIEAEAMYVPKHTFADFPVDDHLKANIIGKGYTTPTPIQDQVIPEVLKGHDVVGLANTGTGKTATFLIPLIDKVLKLRALGQKERVLIMAPTRELAIQIENEFFGFGKGLQLGSVTCVGGANIVPQIRLLRRDPAFVIGTPGRLKDLAERRDINFKDFSTVVLDEADRMLDMGFVDDMRLILGQMSKDRHTLFFSATLNKDIEKLVHEFLKDPVRISVKTRETAATIDQDVVYTQAGRKFEQLVDILRAPDMTKVLVFGRTKHGVERLARDLNRAGIKSDSIHGDKTHGRRQKALGLFKQSHVNVLVATDVAARGLDISGVSHVINYDLPATYEDYTHRIGRTGRAGEIGKALTFIN
ncbi:MAG: ATP-dependent RNA helicase DeaD [Parcubacteria bacterium C7867-001]|nr:MAG: ATP-dependent RNA helicase DeaD [Parcubacteria bacterium C7867-001]